MTKLPDADDLGRLLTERFGIALTARIGEGADGAFIDVRPDDLHDNEGFVVQTVIGWRSVLVRFRAGTFAGDLLADIAHAPADKRLQFAAAANALRDEGATIRMRINGSAAEPSVPELWPRTWTTMELEVERIPVMLDHDNANDVRDVILSWAGGLLAMLICLLPLEDVPVDEPSDDASIPEGAKQRIEVNRYERSRVNRAVCISIHGTKCAACGFDFSAVYGMIGRDYIHVHHKVPVSALGPGYMVNAVTDLVPVCPNCHAMLHRHDPPLDVEELRILLASQKPRPDGVDSGGS